MNAGHDHVESVEHLVGIVGAVGQDIGLDAFQNPEALPLLRLYRGFEIQYSLPDTNR
jgi:hypothetical protein